MKADPIRGRYPEISTDFIVMPALAGVATLIATQYTKGTFTVQMFSPLLLTTGFFIRWCFFGIVSHFLFSFSLLQQYRERSMLLLALLRSCALTTYMLAFYLVQSHHTVSCFQILGIFFALTLVYQSVRYKVRYAQLVRHPETVLILGTGREAQKSWKQIRVHCDRLVQFEGFVGESADKGAAPDIMARIVCSIDSLERFLQHTAVDTFVLTSTGPDELAFAEAAKKIAKKCGSRILCAQEPEPALRFVPWSHETGASYVELGRLNVSTKALFTVKSLLDRALAGAALLLAVPIGLPLLLLYRLILGESALVSQAAYGYHRRQFKMWDLRIATGRQRPLYDASKLRIRRVATIQARVLARVGYFLQISGLARAPRLWNVFVGEMSLVGPRPILPAQIAVGDPTVLLRRLMMRAGLCWPKGETVRTEDQATLAYLEHWSPTLDWMTFTDWFSSRARRTLYAISASLVPDHTPLAEPTRRP